MISFNMGIPAGGVPIVVEGYGLATFVRHYENEPSVLIYVGGNRSFVINGATRWRYAE